LPEKIHGRSVEDCSTGGIDKWKEKQWQINKVFLDDSEKKCRTRESKVSMSIQKLQIKIALLYKELLVLNVSTMNISLTFLAVRAGTH